MEILIVEDRSLEKVRESFVDDEIVTAENLQAAKECLRERLPQVIILDFKFPKTAEEGAAPAFAAGELLEFLQEEFAGEDLPRIILITGENDVASKMADISKWRRRGLIDDIVLKTQGWELFQETLRMKVDDIRVRLQSRPRGEIVCQVLADAGIAGGSRAIRRVGELIEKYAKTDEPVLILGETGVGKELVARALHQQSGKKGDFVPVDLTARAPNLVESDLFGTVPGAYNDAPNRSGIFEQANGGTLLLDEIQNLSDDVQAKLLRVVDEKRFSRFGASDKTQSSFRLVAATDANLEQLVKEGRFRPQLFHRLNVLVIRVPPLRERREDIAELAHMFLDQLNASARKQAAAGSVPPDKDFARGALQAMTDFDWPGNVRELRNCVTKMFYDSTSEEMSVEDFWIAVDRPSPATAIQDESDPLLLDELIRLQKLASPSKNPGMFDEFRKIIAENPTLSDRRREDLLGFSDQVRGRSGDNPAAVHLLQLVLILVRRGRISKGDFEEVCKQIPNGVKRDGKTKAHIKPTQIGSVIDTCKVLSPSLFKKEEGSHRRIEVMFAGDVGVCQVTPDRTSQSD